MCSDLTSRSASALTLPMLPGTKYTSKRRVSADGSCVSALPGTTSPFSSLSACTCLRCSLSTSIVSRSISAPLTDGGGSSSSMACSKMVVMRRALVVTASMSVVSLSQKSSRSSSDTSKARSERFATSCIMTRYLGSVSTGAVAGWYWVRNSPAFSRRSP